MTASIQIMKNLAALILLLSLAGLADARVLSAKPDTAGPGALDRRFLFLVDSPSVVLDYHNGPVLTGSNGSIPVYIIWYGSFNETDKTTVRDFFASFQADNGSATDVSRWWNTTTHYKDIFGHTVANSVVLAGELNDTFCSRGDGLTDADIEAIVVSSLSTFPSDSEAIYLVITSANVHIESFCRNSCSSHFSTSPSTTGGLQLPYAWVGNPREQCPGLCAWPFAQPSYMPANGALPLPPNGDVGADGMIIQISYMLAGTATNPFDTAFYQGDPTTPLEAGTACFGFGVGAYTGYPGLLQRDIITGAQYNAVGADNRKFLLPTLWDPTTRTCSPMTFTAP